MATTLPALSAAIGVSEDGLALLDGVEGSEAFVERLRGAELLEDAVRVVAAILAPRESVWWAWMTVRAATPDDAAQEITDALSVIERWLREPSDPNRRAAFSAGEAADLSTPVGCVALATFFSGGSIAPPEVEPVYPPPHLASRLLAAAIFLSSVAEAPETAPEKLARALEQGMHVARRVGVWKG